MFCTHDYCGIVSSLEQYDSKNSTGTARGIHYSTMAKYSNHKYVMHTTNNSSLQFIPHLPFSE